MYLPIAAGEPVSLFQNAQWHTIDMTITPSPDGAAAQVQTLPCFPACICLPCHASLHSAFHCIFHMFPWCPYSKSAAVSDQVEFTIDGANRGYGDIDRYALPTPVSLCNRWTSSSFSHSLFHNLAFLLFFNVADADLLTPHELSTKCQQKRRQTRCSRLTASVFG